MDAEDIRDKFLGLFNKEQREEVGILLNSLELAHYQRGVKNGRREAGTLLEQIVLGKAEVTVSDLKSLIKSLRGDN